MKKIIFVFMVSLLSIGCASAPKLVTSGPDFDMIQGVWVKENGATYTFTGNEYTLVDITNGTAEYGTFGFRENGILRLNVTLLIDLYNSTPENVTTKTRFEGVNGKMVSPREFQVQALEEWHRLNPGRMEEILTDYPSGASWYGVGNALLEFNFNDLNTLFLQNTRIEAANLNSRSDIDSSLPYWKQSSLRGSFVKSGTFVRQ